MTTRHVRLTGWNDGLEKIALVQLIREFCGLRLGDAKRAVDRLLEGDDVEFDLPARRAAAFAAAATAFGAVAKVDPEHDGVASHGV